MGVPEFPGRLLFEPQVAEVAVARLQNALSKGSGAPRCKRRGKSAKWLFTPASSIGSLFDELRSAAGVSTESKEVAEQLAVVSEGAYRGHTTAAGACGESPPSLASEGAFK